MRKKAGAEMNALEAARQRRRRRDASAAAAAAERFPEKKTAAEKLLEEEVAAKAQGKIPSNTEEVVKEATAKQREL